MEGDIEWLERNTLAWQPFEILDDWLDSVENERISRGFEEVVLLPVLRHAEALLRMILARYQAMELKFEWGWHENCTALSLMRRLVGAGGKDEAWYYRQDNFDLWQMSGGLERLRQQGATRQK